MVGMKQFDQDAVLDRIVAAFWEGGFEGTSIDDLVAATGLKRGSLYNAFGDKEAMFLKALDRYRGTVTSPMLAALQDDDPERGLRQFIDAHIERMGDPACPSGCLVVGACTELGGRRDRLGDRVASELSDSEKALIEALRRWTSTGQLRADLDAVPAARYLGALLKGMAATHRGTGNLQMAKDAGRIGFTVVDTWLARRTPRSA
jgi:TetR/AcrR family transcriptional regulator, transcriptional repressor for nem operon